MRRIRIAIIWLLTTGSGWFLLALQKGWGLLDVAGRTEVATKVPTWFGEMQHFVLAHTELGWQVLPWVLMIVPTCFLALLQWPQLWPFRWPQRAAQRVIPALPTDPPHPASRMDIDRTSLRDAATDLYNYAQMHKANDDDLELMTGWAEAAATSPDDVLNHFGVYIAQTKHVSVSGRRPPATVSRDLTTSEVMTYQIADGATNLRDKITDRLIFTDLTVKRADVANLITSSFGTGSSVVTSDIARATMKLEDAVKWITRRDELPRAEQLPSENNITKALQAIKERAEWGAITVFGGKDWYTTPPAQYDDMTRSPIPKDYWKDHLIDGIDFLDFDRRGHTRTRSRPTGRDDYFILWLDRNEVMREWPR